MDYWPHLDYVIYESFEEFYERNKGERMYLSTTKAENYYDEVEYKSGDFIIFGRESSGVPAEMHELFYNSSIKIPMLETSDRSLNLSNSVAIVAYEALRQIGFPHMK